MSWTKAAAFAAIATISFTGNYLVSASMVTAKANDAMAVYAPGGEKMREWCEPANFERIEWIAAWALRDIGLSDEQQALFDEVLAASKRSVARAETLCRFDRASIHALPMPEQLETLKTMLGEAEQVIDGISAPFAAFHASLSAGQAETLRQLMNHEGGGERRGWWRRRG